MDIELLTAFSLFALVSSITPGPNNLMLMASGANFGFRRTIPHMVGVGVGFVIMVVLVGLGLVSVFDTYPLSYQILRAASITYLIWLAWKIATARPPARGAAAGRPFTFLQAALFQWVNPKGWAMALTAVTVYAPTRDAHSVLLIAAIRHLLGSARGADSAAARRRPADAGLQSLHGRTAAGNRVPGLHGLNRRSARIATPPILRPAPGRSVPTGAPPTKAAMW